MESSSSTSGSSKRARAPTGGNQVVSCLVDGCRSDLSKCRDYHRRHKVCELHSKTPKVTIGGREQRFCQQCSRFHSLGEFDEGKRSCRKRLEGHNRRRRKPQPDSLPVKPSNFLSSARGSRFLPFSSSPVIPSSSVVNSTWSGAVKSENSPDVYSSHMQIDMLGAHRSVPGSSYSHTFRGRQFPFLQGLSSDLHGSSSTASRNGGSNNQNHNNHHHHPNDFSSGGLNQGIDSALSLLSSSPAETPETSLSRMVQPNHAVPQQVRGPSLISGLHYNSIGQISSSCQQLQGSDLMPNSSNLHHCQDVYQAGHDGSCSVSGPQQTLSFLWE